MHNCLSIPFDYLLSHGFNTRQTDVRPANSINTAFQLIAVIFQVQSLQQFGGVSATHLDWTLLPYVRKSFRKHMRNYYECVEGLTKEDAESRIKDIEKNYGEVKLANDEIKSHFPLVFNYALKMTEKETIQGAEGLYHNLNTLQLTHNNQVTNGCLAA